MKKFVPLTLEGVEEGNFLVDANSELKAVQSSLLSFKERYGQQSKGAVASVTFTVTIKIDEPDQDLFSIKSQCSRKEPGRPAYVTSALADFTEDHVPTLFIKSSGSDSGDPRQMRLATQDGRTIKDGIVIDGDESGDEE